MHLNYINVFRGLAILLILAGHTMQIGAKGSLVNNISFEVEEGETIAFIGPNGAGKSTTIKMLTGILYPTSGTIKIPSK